MKMNGSDVINTDSDTAGILLFLIGLFMGPVVAIIVNSSKKDHEIRRVRTVQKVAIGSFVMSSLSLLLIFGLNLSEGINSILFQISGLGALIFMFCVSGLMFVGIMTFVKEKLLAKSTPVPPSTSKKKSKSNKTK